MNTYAPLAAGLGIGIATAYRCICEASDVLATHDLTAARTRGMVDALTGAGLKCRRLLRKLRCCPDPTAYLAEATVKSRLGRILHRLELRDRVRAVIFAHENGLLPSPA
ncbi:hypothetical protein GCM10010329_61610 [Streptomyces spiroverticillatus]|uniref:Uncharacterized protein n=1 Tax=Streptomyces finlayi TaxID=67296 RepID=A0A919CEC2_9ACTN|nr:hypothetical protein GCM10010329_61610 [Streptomyces spiroverticillatus]GHD15099.1 hypothetical protein GCM10010334_74840 [Streptomyces finlayi]